MTKTRTVTAVTAIVALLAVAGTAVAQNAQRFSDVPTDAAYHDAVEWATTNGMAGCGDGKFCPEDTLTKADLATILYESRKAPFSGVGDEVTDDITLKPGYYTVSVTFFPKAGYDWDDDKEHDFYARFESKAGGVVLVDGDWGGHWPAEIKAKTSNKHSVLYRWHHFRVDETADHWFKIETSGKIAWVADVGRYASQPGSRGFTPDEEESDD